MKKLLLILLCVPLISCDTSSQKKTNSRYNQNLKGEVREVIEENIPDPTKGHKEFTKQYFNLQGNLIKKIEYYELTKSRYEYNYKYDNNENCIEEKSDECTFQYIYDKNQHLIETYKYDSTGNLDYKWEYEYDRNGKLISTNGEMIRTSTPLSFPDKYRYNKNGDLIEHISYNDLGEPMYSWTYKYTYDYLDNWTVQTTFRTDFVHSYSSDLEFKYETLIGISKRDIYYY